MNNDVYKFIDEQVAKGYDLMGIRTELVEMISKKFNRSEVTARKYISKYCDERGYPKKREFEKDKVSKLKPISKIEKRICLGQDVKVSITNERNTKATEYKGKIIQVTKRLLIVNLGKYNIAINIADLTNPYKVTIKVKETGEYKGFNLKGYAIKSEFDLRKLII